MTAPVEVEGLLPGCLYVVATPIGNLGDLSPRAQAVLASVEAICAEDTRMTGPLLAHFGISRPLRALHEHNESRVTAELIGQMQAGKTLALVSDAGTPLVSDPGYALVKAARDAGLPVMTVPGPCAVTAALSIAGLPTDEFTFAGFLPARGGPRRARLQVLAAESRTWVIYEAPHRILECVEDLALAVGPERRVFLARELTKRFEQSVQLPAGDLLGWLQADSNRQRGEFVLAVAGLPATTAGATLDARTLMSALLTELPPGKAARIAATLTGEKRQTLYQIALQLGASDLGQ
ncbi:MAG: 16S rRNA (cytidine(1402)-2'-O)-methyltransferase [Pseudomonadota bacterium]